MIPPVVKRKRKAEKKRAQIKCKLEKAENEAERLRQLSNLSNDELIELGTGCLDCGIKLLNSLK